MLGDSRVNFREGNGTPVQYSCLENPTDGGAWWAAVHGVSKSQTRLCDFHYYHHSFLNTWQKVYFVHRHFHIVIIEEYGTPLQHSCLENPMDRGAWWAAVHGITKSRTWLNDFTFHFHALEKEMATHSSVLAWRIPGAGEPGGLPSMGSHRVGHGWSNLAAAAAYLNLN